MPTMRMREYNRSNVSVMTLLLEYIYLIFCNYIRIYLIYIYRNDFSFYELIGTLNINIYENKSRFKFKMYIFLYFFQLHNI